MEAWTVYILKCSDGRIYVGCTHDLTQRIAKHESGLVEFTKSRLPVAVILTVSFPERHKAYFFERYLKSGSGREFMRRHFL